MHAAQEMPKRRGVRYELKRFVSLGRRRDIRERQRNAACDLHDKGNERRAPKDIPPFRIFRRYMLHRREQDADPEPIVEPIPDYLEQLDHSAVEIGTIACFICTSPFTTRTS